ncbi:hypothetical protein JNUCC1_00940 [Lentibacillus sp. JNUCC-1]|uniref:DnaD domain-containing protein n=1 Tax=Lentibacillus sp. JNUCC-1 TaxID=2654513 RepID=UPI0012E94BDD|nr:DnaD domain protein [Lentibacillus sp. JNUCC-1]MUV37134.1 hypothetical protein [Lentibacillus sp. JNUCC-1]
MVSQQQAFTDIADAPESVPNSEKAMANSTEQAPTVRTTHANQNDDIISNHKPTHTEDHKMDHTTGPLFKQDDTQDKQTHTITPADQHDHQAGQFYKAHFGMPTQSILTDIATWITDTNDELVAHAMKLALERGKPSWAYVKGILKAWARKNIMTIADAKQEAIAYSTKHQPQKPRSYFSPSSFRQEVIPDWFNEQKKQGKARESTKADQHIINPQHTRAELRRMLDEFN